MNHKRDYKSLSVLGFEKGSHGQSIATLSCSDREVNTGNLPLYDWPVAPLPKFKYPYAEHEHANRAEEERCLKAASDIIKSRRA
jgi:4-aminobutyrate aminotransferase / (S)-3-amino-2-methylpropionate transaminase